jgi:hypothetical protein
MWNVKQVGVMQNDRNWRRAQGRSSHLGPSSGRRCHSARAYTAAVSSHASGNVPSPVAVSSLAFKRHSENVGWSRPASARPACHKSPAGMGHVPALPCRPPLPRLRLDALMPISAPAAHAPSSEHESLYPGSHTTSATDVSEVAVDAAPASMEPCEPSATRSVASSDTVARKMHDTAAGGYLTTACWSHPKLQHSVHLGPSSCVPELNRGLTPNLACTCSPRSSFGVDLLGHVALERLKSMQRGIA